MRAEHGIVDETVSERLPYGGEIVQPRESIKHMLPAWEEDPPPDKCKMCGKPTSATECIRHQCPKDFVYAA